MNKKQDNCVIELASYHYDKRKKELEESEERYRQLVEFFPDAICVHKNSKIVFFNDAFLKLFDIDDYEEYIGRSVMDFLHPKYHQIVKKRIEDVKEIGDTVPPLEETLIGIDGKEIYVEVKATAIPYKGDTATLLSVRDISSRKKAEELQRKLDIGNQLLYQARQYDKLKTGFLANISHELRTPINILLGSIQVLELYKENISKTEEKEKVEERIEVMRQNCFRLLRSVNNLIDITKIDSGYFNLKLQNYDIIDIIEDITLFVAEYINGKDINLTFDTEIEEKIMSCDPEMIERIILNLLSNSVKFTNVRDSIMVNIYDEEESIVISVKDTGIGIPEDKLNRIFEKFEQVDKSLNRNHEGSGMGLSLVKALVEMHGGSIHIESEYGVGSEFIIELPVRVDGENEVFERKDNNNYDDLIGRIKVEFSDIYS